MSTNSLNIHRFFSCKKRSLGARNFYSIMLSKFRRRYFLCFHNLLYIKLLPIVRGRLRLLNLLKRGSKSFPYGLQKGFAPENTEGCSTLCSRDEGRSFDRSQITYLPHLTDLKYGF